jgi:cysteine desulfurase
VPNTLNLSFHGLEANRLLEAIGPKVAASAGAACHAGSVAVSPVLSEMNVPLDWAKGSIRFSVGRMTTDPEIDKTIQVVVEAVKSLRKI